MDRDKIGVVDIYLKVGIKCAKNMRADEIPFKEKKKEISDWAVRGLYLATG